MRYNILFVLISIFCFFVLPSTIYSQSLGIGVAQYMQVSEPVEDGDIVSIVNNEFVKSSLLYDPGVVGVVVETPAISINLNPQQADNESAILDSGETLVKVSTANGNIEVGDILTTSEIPGVAVKSTRPGFAIGIANQPFISDDPNEIGKINTSVHLHYSYSTASETQEGLQESVTSLLNFNRVAAYESPSTVLQYSISGLILILAIAFGFFTFSRAAAKGIEATGRNPMASRVIGVSVVLNVVITIVIIIAAVVLAYFIISI